MVAITSRRLERPGPYDHPVKDWERAGLLGPSVVRAGKLVTIHRSLIRRQLGSVGPDELSGVERLVCAALGLRGRSGRHRS